MHMTPREMEILVLLSNGETTRSISEKCFVSFRTVEIHRAHLFEKFGVHTAPHLIAAAFRMGLIT